MDADSSRFATASCATIQNNKGYENRRPKIFLKNYKNVQ